MVTGAQGFAQQAPAKVMTSTYPLAVTPLSSKDIALAKTSLRKAIKKQLMLGRISRALGGSIGVFVAFTLIGQLKKTVDSRTSSIQGEQNASTESANSQDSLPSSHQRNSKEVMHSRVIVRGFSDDPYVGEMLKQGSHEITWLPFKIGKALYESLPMLMAAYLFTATQQYLAQFTRLPEYQWFTAKYTSFDELYLRILMQAAILDWESSLLKDVKIGHLQNIPKSYSELSAEELTVFLKTAAVNNDHTIRSHEAAAAELTMLLQQLRLQYAHVIAFCGLKKNDATRNQLIYHYGVVLQESFNSLLTRMAYPSSPGLLYEIMLGINNQQQTLRSLMIATFPYEIERIGAD